MFVNHILFCFYFHHIISLINSKVNGKRLNLTRQFNCEEFANATAREPPVVGDGVLDVPRKESTPT